MAAVLYQRRGNPENMNDPRHQRKRSADIQVIQPFSTERKGPLSLNDLGGLLDLLLPIAKKWFNIGIKLKIDVAKLGEIRVEFTSHSDGLREMLILFLRQEEATWEMVSAALRSRTVDEKRMANEIDLNYDVVDEQSDYIGEEIDTISSENDQLTFIPHYDMHNHHHYSMFMEKRPHWTNSERVDHTFKIIVLGDPGVGKTSILRRFALACPCEEVRATLQVDNYIRVVKVKDGPTIKLELWDTAGYHVNFLATPNSYFHKVDAALIVFDLSDNQSYLHAVSYEDSSKKKSNLKSWFKELRYRLDDEMHDLDTITVLVGNKNDKKKREVSLETAKQFADKKNLDYVETSSKEDNNIDFLFFLVCQRLLEVKKCAVPVKDLNFQQHPITLQNTTTDNNTRCCHCCVLL